MTKVSRCHSGVHKLRCGGCQGNVSLKHNSVNYHCFHRQKSPPATLLPALHRKHHLWFSPESFPNKFPSPGIARNLLSIYEVNQTEGAAKHRNERMDKGDHWGLENLFPENLFPRLLGDSTGRQGTYKVAGLSRCGLKK